MKKLPWLPLLVWMVLVVMSFGCAALTQQATPPVEPSEEVDTIATAVAGTLAAGEQLTATAYMQIEATSVAGETQAAATAVAQVSPTPVTSLTQVPAQTVEATPTGSSLTPTSRPEQGSLAPGDVIAAFVGPQRNLWVWRGGESVQLTETGDVAEVSISDDAAWIAFSRTSDFTRFSLWIIRSDGSDEREVMSVSAFEALPHDTSAVSVVPLAITWQPGTHTLAFTTRPTFEGPGLMLNDDLWLIDADTGEQRELLPAGEGGHFYFSPDGAQIAIVRPTSVSLINSDGTSLQKDVLVYPEVSTYSEYRFYAVPQWDANGRSLRVVIPPPASLEHPEDSTTIWEIPADGSPAQQIGSVQTVPLSTAMLSPDLQKLAYLAQSDGSQGDRMELHIANADGSNDTLYQEEQLIQFVSWSPDSSRFVFTMGDNLRAYLGRVGAAPQPFTDTPSTIIVRWIDADHFFFIGRDAGGFQLHIGAVGQESQIIAGEESAGSELEQFPEFDFTQRRP